MAVSGDGSIIVGSGSTSSGDRASIWDAAHGMRDLRDVLVNDYGLGASLDGWILTAASAISPDGKFIIGYGTSPNTSYYEGWIADLTLSPALAGNFNGDGVVDAADLAVWSASFGTTSGANERAGPRLVAFS